MGLHHIITDQKFAKDGKAETAITHMIFFITAIVVAMMVVLVLSQNVQSITSATAANSKVLSEQIRTDITIINDPEQIPYDNSSNHYTFYAKNTGNTELNKEYLDIFVDGIFIDPSLTEISMLDHDTLWRPGDILIVNITSQPMERGDHRLHIAVENGKTDSMSFKIY